MRLTSNMSPLLTDQNLNQLHVRKIYTVLQFLDADPEKVAKNTLIALEEIKRLRELLLLKYSTFPMTGCDAFKDVRAFSTTVSFNVPRLDALLDGGLAAGEIFEVYGFSGCGKTQLCLTLSASAACRQQTVFYLDCKHDFSGKRVMSILQSQGFSTQDIKIKMEMIRVVRPTSAHQLISFIPEIYQDIQEHKASHTSVLIVDSLCSLFYPYYSGDTGNLLSVFGLLNSLGIALRQLACEVRVAVVLVNLSKQWNDEDAVIDQAAFGKLWASFPNTRVCMHRDDTKLVLDIVKSTRLPYGGSCVLNITSKGIE